MRQQKTIKNEAKIAGKSLFAGVDAKVVFKPAPANTGVVFVRTDLPDPVQILATPANIGQRQRRT